MRQQDIERLGGWWVVDESEPKDPGLALLKGIAWFSHNQALFQYRGGRLLSSAFPQCSPEFAAALAELVRDGGNAEATFALAILQNYEGEVSTHAVLKEIVAKYVDDPKGMSAVKISIESTGVVRGELGFADAWRERKASLAPRLEDERPAVRGFAARHIAELDQQIANEHRPAEAAREMRNRDYDGADDGSEEKGGD